MLDAEDEVALLTHLQEGRCKATWKGESKFPCREAGPPDHQDARVDSDQWIFKKELFLSAERTCARSRGKASLQSTQEQGYPACKKTPTPQDPTLGS